MLPYQIWKSGCVWRVWRQTCQTDGVLLMHHLKLCILRPYDLPGRILATNPDLGIYIYNPFYATSDLS